ncbi:hypothetical protein [Streptomyces sp. TS71-3]|uniref:hypothetical protein n=1 Tax=Streptomyces sp. TS71-3 TaxID=2733862 RepID=UPI001B12DA2A|nr:hypothetical protein [Streptomyces sp. TS71-3]GHJ38685.1 hypothetical protein Sm713_42940 [Streptomyces sp. TS71-3]
MTQLLEHGNRTRLAIPARFYASLGYDAVGMPAERGRRIVMSLPTVGCIYALGDQWWWIVPAGSDIDVKWPSFTRYAPGGYVSVPGPSAAARTDAPRLIHHPTDDSPYTPPIPLYFLTCHHAGVVPTWSLPAGS